VRWYSHADFVRAANFQLGKTLPKPSLKSYLDLSAPEHLTESVSSSQLSSGNGLRLLQINFRSI